MVLLNTAIASTVPVPNDPVERVTLNVVVLLKTRALRSRIVTGQGVMSRVKTPVAAHCIPNVPFEVEKSAPKLTSTIRLSPARASAYNRTARAFVNVVDDTATSFMSYMIVPVGDSVSVGAVDVPPAAAADRATPPAAQPVPNTSLVEL